MTAPSSPDTPAGPAPAPQQGPAPQQSPLPEQPSVVPDQPSVTPQATALAEIAPPPEVTGKPKKKRHRLRNTLIGVASGIVVLALVAAGLVVWSVRRAFPSHDGSLALPGLSAPVTVYRDQYGIPQLYAANEEDLFRAQGYVHAQDRFWEMDFRRHVTAGRLSELFGESQVETDAFLRTLGWRRIAEQEWSLLAADTKRYLQAYADGVNAWLNANGGSAASGAKSLEYTILGLTNRDYQIEPWEPADTIAWLKAMAWDLRGNMTDEIDRAVLLASGLTREQVADLYPEYPYELNLPIIPEDPNPPVLPPVVTPGDQEFAPIKEAAAALTGLGDLVASLPALLGDGTHGIGSNSWAVSGEHTTTGKPLLANDPHLSSSMPGIWYQIGLHCTCDINVTGFSFSGVPGVVIGHTGKVAWGFTNLGPDVTDLYLERLDGDRYFDGTEWQALQVRQEEIKVAGGEPVTITVRSTKHGPLLSDRSQDLLTIAARPPVDRDGAPVDEVRPAPTPSLDGAQGGVPDAAQQSPYGVALRWTALDPGKTMDAVFAIDRVTDWDSFREAAASFEVPAQNLLYADVDGNIGYQSPGKIPVRGKGDGTWPSPGWDPAYDWQGFIPFEKLPSVFNPDEGYIVTANQSVVGTWYPYLLTKDWSYGYRSQRIRDMLAERIADGPIDAEAIRQLQFDNRNGFAPTVVEALSGVSGLPAEVSLLRGWDFQQGADSAAAALYNVFWRELLRRTFDELPDGRPLDAGDKWWVVMDALLAEPDSAWWDDQSTPAHEDRDDILSAALTQAVAELKDLQGTDPAKWRWGALHTITLTNATFGESGIAPIEWLFNRGPFETSGGNDIVNATGWSYDDGTFEVTAVPSMRMIVDLSDLDRSRWVQLTGNSGHAFHPNYDDQFPLWRVGDNLPMWWDRDSVEAAATHIQTLHP